jgi:fructose-1,6-bisphosphatase/inositol monophosphatase family enzyme
LDEGAGEAVARNAHRFGEIRPGRKCAATEYPDVICGDQHFALYWRALPWDHAPGSLLLTEAGGVARRPDGTEYSPGDQRFGLLAARNAATWHLAIGLIQ